MVSTSSERDINTQRIGADTDTSKDVELGQGKVEADASVQEDLDEGGNAYSLFAKVLVIMIALYLALFIVALVSLPACLSLKYNKICSK